MLLGIGYQNIPYVFASLNPSIGVSVGCIYNDFTSSIQLLTIFIVSLELLFFYSYPQGRGYNQIWLLTLT